MNSQPPQSQGGGGSGGTNNPFQSMGISDSDYIDILTNIATNNEGAQKLEVETDGGKNMFRTLGGESLLFGSSNFSRKRLLMSLESCR